MKNSYFLLGTVFLFTTLQFVVAQSSLIHPVSEQNSADSSWENVPLLTLFEAVKMRKVSVQGSDPKGYQQVQLELTNRTRSRLAVDIAGSHIIPITGDCQRLGLGPVVNPAPNNVITRRGQVIVRLEPDQKQMLRVNTCCLDAGKASPSTQRFSGASDALPNVREKVLRWWVENPEVPQSAVNSAIWQNQDTVQVSPEIQKLIAQKQSSFSFCDGTLYQLEKGELQAIKTNGTKRFLGTDILQVIPTEAAIYAVTMEEKEGNIRKILWSLSMTGEESWLFITPLHFEETLLDILIAQQGDLVLISTHQVKLFQRDQKILQTLFSSPLPIQVQRVQKNVLKISIISSLSSERASNATSTFKKMEIWELNFEKKSGKMLKKIASHFHTSETGSAGTFLLSPTGKLYQFHQNYFKQIPHKNRFTQLLFVGKQILWLKDAEQHLVAFDLEQQNIRFRMDLSEKGFPQISLDFVTDDLALKMDNKLYSLSAQTGILTEFLMENISQE